LAATSNIDAPVRMSTPGHSTSGAEGVGDAGCVTPGFALEKRLVNRLLSDGALSMMLEAPEQPESATAPISATTARLRPRARSSPRPGHIEITQLFPTSRPLQRALYQSNHGDPKANWNYG